MTSCTQCWCSGVTEASSGESRVPCNDLTDLHAIWHQAMEDHCITYGYGLELLPTFQKVNNIQIIISMAYYIKHQY